jgi:hypothetical protein
MLLKGGHRGFIASYPSLSPGFVNLESARLLLLGAAVDWILVLGFDDDDEAWGGCGADLDLVRVFVSCEDTLVWCVAG